MLTWQGEECHRANKPTCYKQRKGLPSLRDACEQLRIAITISQIAGPVGDFTHVALFLGGGDIFLPQVIVTWLVKKVLSLDMFPSDIRLSAFRKLVSVEVVSYNYELEISY